MKHVMIDGTKMMEYIRIRQSIFTTGPERLELERIAVFVGELMREEVEKGKGEI